MAQILCSTGALIGRPNNRDYRILRDVCHKLNCDGFEFMMYSTWYGLEGDILKFLLELNINIPVCGLVKDDKHATRGIIYNNEELIINRSSNLMQLIRRIQDEVHRFAITYHRSLRDKRTLHSVLDDIPNVGEKRRRALLMKFGSVDNIKSATLEQLLETPSINNKAAESIYQYFNGNESK